MHIGGNVVASSIYKQGHQVITDSRVPTEFTDFAQEMVNLWQPADAFVIDIPKTQEGFKVIEINNINSSGFYKANAYDIIKTIKTLET